MINVIREKKDTKLFFVLETLLFSILIIAVLYLNVKKIMLVHIATDEFGYWTAAANFLGWDWSDSASVNSYYSYGYGIVIAPIIYLFKSPELVYKVTLFQNMIFLVIGFYILVNLLKKIYTNISIHVIVFVSFVTTLYVGNVFYSVMTMSECYIWMLFLLVTNWIYDYFVNEKRYKIILTAVLIGYMFMVHMRCITLGLVVGMVLFVAFIIKKESRKKEFLYLVIFGIIWLAELYFAVILKRWLVERQYMSVTSQASGMNSISGSFSMVKHIFSLNGVLCLLETILGRVYYLGISTLLMFYYGMYHMCKNIIVKFKDKLYGQVFFYSFIILGTLAAIGISAVSMINLQDARIDTLFYGRYSDYVVAVIFPISLLEAFVIRKDKVHLGSFVRIQLLLSIAVMCWVRIRNLMGMLDVSIPSLYCFFINPKLTYVQYFIVGLVYTLVAIVFISVLLRKNNYTTLVVALVLLIVGWVVIGSRSIKVSDTHNHDEEYYEVYQVLNKNIDDNDVVYYCYTTGDIENYYNFQGISRIQFCLRDTTIRFVNYDEYNTIPNDAIIITRSNSRADNIIDDTQLLENVQFNVYRKVKDYEKGFH